MSKNPKHSPFNPTYHFWYTFTHLLHKIQSTNSYLRKKGFSIEPLPFYGGEKFLTLSRERGGGDFRTGNAQSNHFSMIIPAGQSHNFYLPTKIKLIIIFSKPVLNGSNILKLIPKSLKEVKEAEKRFKVSKTVSLFKYLFVERKTKPFSLIIFHNQGRVLNLMPLGSTEVASCGL